MLLEAIAALDAPGYAGFSPALRDNTRARLISAVGLTDAVLGYSSAWERAQQLEALPDHRVNAWRLRYFIHLFRPDARRAQECRREIELLQLQEGPRQSSEGSMIETELLAFVHCDDLLGLARLKPVVDARAQRFPGWVPWSLIVEAELERMRSRFDRALELYPRALALTVPDKDMAWVHGAALHLDALVQAGRAAEAERLGRVWLPFAFENRLDAWVLIASALALAEAALGDHESAMLRSTEALHELERRGVLGIYYGLALESAARIAIECGDAEAFKQFFARCWEQYGGGAYPPITARLERMLTAARRKQLVDATQDAAPDASAWPERVRAELGQATDAGDRARRALSLLLESSHAISGHLYGIKGAEIELMASHAPAAPEPALEKMLRDFLRAESDEDRTLALDEIALVRPSMRTRSAADRDGLRYFPFLLATGQGSRTIAAGVVALAFANGKLAALPAALTSAIGEELLAARNVTGITLAR
jgi:hypothetical protein